jgi:D-glycero-D-manno-heptose 1,7-bisphosphate phosphatase
MRLVILDRDGVVNEDSPAFVKRVSEWVPIPGSLESIARLSQCGYSVAIATNQSGVARGLLTIDDLNAIHERLHSRLAGLGGRIDAIFFCPHGPDARCTCRKPSPGLLFSAEERLGLPLKDAVVVGDSLRDLEAARLAGAASVLVLTGKGEETLAHHRGRLAQVPVYPDLSSAVDAMLATLR